MRGKNKIKKRLLSVLLSMAILCGTLSFPAMAAEEKAADAKVITVTSDISVSDLKNKWNEQKQDFFGDWYKDGKVETAPSAYPVPKLGELDPKFLRDGINMTNFLRYTAHLPADVKLDAELTTNAQHGATLLAVANQLTHTPKQPAGIDDAFYKIGYESTTTSNISKGIARLNHMVLGFMRDASPSNISSLGHRRWILNPKMEKTGFGMNQYVDFYGVMQAFDESRTEKVDYDIIPLKRSCTMTHGLLP